MNKNITTILLVCAVALGFALSGCGSVASTDSPTGTSVTGVVSLGTTTNSTVSLKDSSVPAKEMTTTPGSNGTYAVNVSGLTPPFLLKATWTDTSGSNRVYSFSTRGGRANINSLSDTVVAAASYDTSPDELYEKPDPMTYRNTSDRLSAVINSLRTMLAPLFELYQTSGDPITDSDEAHNRGLHAMLRDVQFVVKSGTVTVTNKLTNAVIYSAPLNGLDSGTFNPGNMPAGPGGTTSGATLYANNCSTCHGPLATSSKIGATADDIQSAIMNDMGGMSKFSSLTAAQIQAIATALATVITPPPAGCTYTYSPWNACRSDNTQTRSMLTSSPAGCTGTPVLSQACIYVPPVTTCTSFTYSAWGACQSNNTQTRTQLTASPSGCTGGTPVLSQACIYVPPVTTCTSFTYSAWGACQSNNTQTRTQLTASPSGCTGGTPVLSQACIYVPPVTTCTSFTYSAWGACQSNNTQTRTQLTASPSGCTGGTPVLSQACIYVPPVTTCTSFTYSAWGACQSNNTQTRTQLTASPSGCTGGTPILSQACTYVPPVTLTLAQVTTTCTRCHGLTVNTTVLKTGGYTVKGRSASAWVSAITGMGATLAPGTTLQDYGNFLAALP